MRNNRVLIGLYLISVIVGLYALFSLVGLDVEQTGWTLPATFIAAITMAVICLRLVRPDAYSRMIDLLVCESDQVTIKTKAGEIQSTSYCIAFEYHPGEPGTPGVVRVLLIDPEKANDVVHVCRLSGEYITHAKRREATEVALASFGIQQSLRLQSDPLSLPRLGNGRHARTGEDRRHANYVAFFVPSGGLLLSCLPFRFASLSM